MQFKIPQDVQRADKIVGPLTLRQLIIVVIGGGITYSVYTILAKQYFFEVWLLPVLFTAGITALFAFFQYHGLPFEKLLLVFIEFKFLPRQRVWQKMQGDTLISVLSPIKARALGKKEMLKEEKDQERLKKLHEMIEKVDTSGTSVLHKKNK